jgi:hypothetical protein
MPEPVPETLPRDHFLATEPNYISLLVWGVIAYFTAKKMEWL